MDLNAEYTLTISKSGHITKKFYFNTKGVPDERAKEEFGGQDIEVSIFEMPKDPGVVAQINQILSQPMAKFYYDEKINQQLTAYLKSKGMLSGILNEFLELVQIDSETKFETEIPFSHTIIPFSFSGIRDPKGILKE